MDTAQWMQEIGESKSMGEITGGTSSSASCAMRQPAGSSVDQRKVRPPRDAALNCPRCHSTNTKFCYYNNYSLTQPRYFCKTCRRYWTEGGTLRNVPVGGGSRKNKKYSSAASTTTSSSSSTTTSASISVPMIVSNIPDLNPPSTISDHHQLFPSHDHENPKISMSQDHQLGSSGHDLNLGFTRDYNNYRGTVPADNDQFLRHEFFPKNNNGSATVTAGLNGINMRSLGSSTSANSSSSSSSAAAFSGLNLLRNSNHNGRPGLNNINIPFSPILVGIDNNSTESNTLFSSSGLPFMNQECKQTAAASLAFSFDHHHGFNIGMNNSSHDHVSQENISTAGNMDMSGFVFPFGATKRHPSSDEADRDGNSKGRQENISNNGYWNGMLGGGAW